MLITGGSRGIGAATATLAAERGWDICLSYLSNETAAMEVANRIKQMDRRVLVVRADISDEASIVSMWEKAIAEFGTIDSLVNNAATLEQQMPLTEFNADRLHRIFSTNVIGCILCTREAVRHMAVSSGGRGGTIINISSAAARLGSPNEYIDYAASKGAIDTMTTGLAKEVGGEGIRVNGIRPGAIHTEIHAAGGEPNRIERLKNNIPMKRGGQSEEIAEAIIWLASNRASYANGAILDVTGGI